MPRATIPNLRALVVRSPWAEQIRDGTKAIEYRTWRTHYRGPLLIVVGRTGGGDLAGKGIAVVDLYDCVQAGHRDFHWKLRDPRPIDPFIVPGRLGIFRVQRPTGQVKARARSKEKPQRHRGALDVRRPARILA